VLGHSVETVLLDFQAKNRVVDFRQVAPVCKTENRVQDKMAWKIEFKTK